MSKAGDMPEDEVAFVLNGIDVRLRNPDPALLLVDYLRSAGVGLTGTKLVCGEGGCGACTVTIAHLDLRTGDVVERPANACLRPLCTLDGARVTTVEGLGRVRTGLNPIQERIAEFNASQCGYCTPGWVMTMYGLLRSNQTPSRAQVEDQFAGNLCRCTGMRPILNAAQSFVGDGAACRQAAGTPHTRADFPSPRRLHIRGREHEYYRALSLDEVLALLADNVVGGPVMLMNGNTSRGIYNRDVYDPRVLIDISCVSELTELAVADDSATVTIGGGVTLTSLREFLTLEATRIAPGKTQGLVALNAHLKRVAGEQVRGVGTVAGNLMLALSHREGGDPFPSDLMTVLGALDATVWLRTPGSDAERSFPLLEFPELRTFTQGLAVTRVTLPATSGSTIVQTYKVARRDQNAHALVNAGFLCDFDAQARVTRARLVVGGIARIACRLSRTEAFLTGRTWGADTLKATRDSLAADVTELLAPAPADGVSNAYRADLVNGLFYKYWLHVASRLEPEEVAPRERSAAELYERPISTGDHRFVEAPYFDGEGHESRTFAASQHPGTLSHASRRRAAPHVAAQVATAEHVIAVNRPEPSAGGDDRLLMKASAAARATGEAKYTQDAPLPPGWLEAAYVCSTEPNARFDYGSLTTAEVAQRLRNMHAGFIAYVTAEDIPCPQKDSDSYSDAAPAAYDPVFASGRVTACGQPIGLVLADTLDTARRAAATAQTLIDYDATGLTPVLTIEQARSLPDGAGLMYPRTTRKKVERPESDQAWLESPGPEPGMTYVNGTQRTGGQAHFYFETQTAVAIPGGNDSDGMLVYSSAQHLEGVQLAVSKALGLPMTKVEARTLRLGGGYGGKELRPPYFAAAAAVAAWKVSRPVRLALDRNTDMVMVGKRHPYEGTFHVLADSTGRIEKMRLDFASDGGYSADCSSAVMDLVLLSADNTYNIPTFQANGDVYRTNLATNTAFRSFGVIQCILILEEAIERVAHELGLPPEEVRKQNFYRDATMDKCDFTPYGQALKYARVNQVWDDILQMAQVDERQAQIAAFNADNRWRKRGLAVIPIKYGISYTYRPMNQATSEIVVYSDGSVLVHHGGIEMGQGIDMKIAQIVADALGIDLTCVQIAPPDTASVANASSTGASASTDLQGGAALAAAKQLRQRLGKFCRRNPALVPNTWETAWSQCWKAIVRAADTARIDLASQASFASPNLGTLVDGQLEPGKQIFYYFTYSAGASEVEIDVLTGETTIIRSDLIYDAGQTINSDLDFGQVEGAFIQGIGNVMTEQLYYDERGRLIPYGTWNYKLPCSKSIPVEFHVALLEYVRTNLATDTPIDHYGIMSSKAVGEPPLVLAASVFFAIKRAVAAARIDAGLPTPFDLPSPATVERIRQACSTS
jgi:xanthine dehydrogenase/oxidase